MPEFDISEHHLVRVEASPERAYDAARGVDLARSRAIRALFAARGIPWLVRGRRPTPGTMRLDDLVKAGFVWLAEDPPTELVLGVVGSFWRPRGGVVRIAP